MNDLEFKGSKYTWWNGQSGSECIFKRHRCLGNQELISKYSGIEVTHLIRSGFDHAPLLISYAGVVESIGKPFKFLNFWAKHEFFLEVVKQHWVADFMETPFNLFQHKLKKVKVALSQWSKATFGNIF